MARSRHGTEFARLVLLLSPAFYCAWLGLSFQLFRAPEVPFRSIQDLFSTSKNDVNCYDLNSVEWLESSRHGNIHLRADDDVRQRDTSLLVALEQTLCPKESLFVGMEPSDSITEERLVQVWTNRLIYFAVYHHQHSPTWKEIQTRSSCADELRDRHIGQFDFECPDTKFLVISLAKNGIGANMRLGAIPGLIAAIATNRVVLFVNAAKTGPRFLQEPWALSSCDRRDYQCFFRPITPCVLTEAELGQAYELQRGEMRSVFRDGIVPEDHANDRILIMHLTYRPQRMPINFRYTLHDKAKIAMKSLGRRLEPYQSILDKALQTILQEDVVPSENFTYYGSGSSVFQSLLLYSLRPNPQATSDLEDIVDKTLSKDRGSGYLLGLPIRASDKCGVESECMSFESHVAALRELIDQDPATVLVSSESPEVLRELSAYTANLSEASPLDFLTNQHDIMQGTGFLPQVGNVAGYSADRAMLSAISSLQLQLHAELTLGNCCSNFHLLLKDLLHAGCGSEQTSTFHCLQQHKNPRYRVCCAWDKTDFCNDRRQNNSEP